MATAVDGERKHGNGRLTEEELMHALPRSTAAREVRVGIFVLIGLAAFLIVLFTMTDVGTFRGRYYVETVVESAGGMRRGDPVQMRGVNVGRVVGFDLVPTGGVDVRMEIYDEYDIPADSRATVKSSGLLGGMVVDIIPGRSEERVSDGAMIPGAASTDVMAQAQGLTSRADTALMRVNQMLSSGTVGAVQTSAVELQGLLSELNAIAAQQRTQLQALSASLRRSAAGVESATTGPELERAVANVDALTAEMEATTRTLNATSTSLQTVIGRLERGEGTLGKLTTDDALYDNLNATVTNLNSLVDDIKANPRKYINLQVF